MSCNKKCKCDELREEIGILYERKDDFKRMRDVLFRIRGEYKQAVDELVGLQRVIVSQAKEIERLKRND